jgi:hypothetical protein
MSLWRCRYAAVLLEAGTAKHRSTLRRFERHSGFYAAFRTCGSSLGANPLAAANSLRFALLAALGVVLELLVEEEDLFAGSKNKLGATVDALQYAIGEFHGRLP